MGARRLVSLTRTVWKSDRFTSKEQDVLGVGLPFLSKQNRLLKILDGTAEGNKYSIAYS